MHLTQCDLPIIPFAIDFNIDPSKVEFIATSEKVPLKLTLCIREARRSPLPHKYAVYAEVADFFCPTPVQPYDTREKAIENFDKYREALSQGNYVLEIYANDVADLKLVEKSDKRLGS